MTKVYLIRHAEAEGNLYRRVQGHYNSLVTELGMKQVEELEKRFSNIQIDAVYSSDLMRTKTTASALYKSHGIQLITNPLLREVKMGIWEDTPWGEVEKFDKKQLANFNSDPKNWTTEGCEPFQSVQDRMTNTITDLASQHEGGTIAVVSHGAAIRSFLCAVLGVPSEEISKIPHFDNTAVTLLNVDQGKIVIEYMGDKSHLPDGYSTFDRQKWWKVKSGLDGANLRYVRMDFDNETERYLRYRKDAWFFAHGSLDGFDKELFTMAKKHNDEHPWALSLALKGDKPMGLIELNINQDVAQKVGNIAFYYMEEPYRGTGMSVQLLGQAVSVFRNLNREKLRLMASENNTRALRFYEKYGFQKAGESSNQMGKLIVMEKNIALE